MTAAAPLQGAHTWLLLPAGDGSFHHGGSDGAGWVNSYTWKLLISGDWDKKTIHFKENTGSGFFLKKIVINKACAADRIRRDKI